MSVHRTRTSRKGEIPHGLVLKWQSSRGGKALIRRPMTACQSCRTAKVKCDGHKECDRCAIRGIVCTYTNTGAEDDTSQHSDHRIPANAVSPPTEMTLPGPLLMEPNMIDASQRFSTDGAVFDNTMDAMVDVDWSNDTNHQRLSDFNWGNIDPQLDVGFYDRNHDTLSGDLMILPNAAIQNITQTAPPFPANFVPPSTLAPSPISSLPSSSTLFSSAKCQCREDLAVLLPKVSDAMQGKQLDKVYQITRKVMQGCLDIVDCTDCQIGCIDLICMTAIFQRTDTCFEYIAKADLDSAIQMNFGGFDVPINDPKLKAMLVVNLIQQASVVLDAISVKGQNMLRALGSPKAFAQTNIDYLETVIRDFREVLRKAGELAQ